MNFVMRFLNFVMRLKATIAYLLMALKKITELQLLWFIEIILSVFNYQICQMNF